MGNGLLGCDLGCIGGGAPRGASQATIMSQAHWRIVAVAAVDGGFDARAGEASIKTVGTAAKFLAFTAHPTPERIPWCVRVLIR